MSGDISSIISADTAYFAAALVTILSGAPMRHRSRLSISLSMSSFLVAFPFLHLPMLLADEFSDFVSIQLLVSSERPSAP